MGRSVLSNTPKQVIKTLSIAVAIFLVTYLGWAFYTTSVIYSKAIGSAEQQAHTIVGKEGYEYIFEPTTQIFIDRIKPNGRAIVSYLVLKNYLPSLGGPECTYPDSEICKWLEINMHFGQDQRAGIRNKVLYSSLLGVILSAAFYYLSAQPRTSRGRS